MTWTAYRQADGRFAVWDSPREELVVIDATPAELIQERIERVLKRLRPELAAALEVAEPLPPAQELRLPELRRACEAREEKRPPAPPRLSQERERARIADHLDAVANLVRGAHPDPDVLQRAARAVRLGYFALALDDDSPEARELLEAMSQPQEAGNGQE